MTASRYHIALPAAEGSGRSGIKLHEVVEVLLRADPLPEPEDRRGNLGRVESHEVLRAAPEIARASQQVVHLKRVLRLDAQLCEIERRRALLRVGWVEIHHHQYDVIAAGGALAVREQLRVVRIVKRQAVVRL